MTQDKPDGPITFVNQFTLTGSPEEFEKSFNDTAEFFRTQPGLLTYTLHKHLEEPDKYVNIARWTDAQALRTAVRHPDFPAHAAALRANATSVSNTYVERFGFSA